ncbi:MAG: hypothetical protein HOP33_06640 [Verrucomicrobia bacterium]|nr:hypothetical protein [Verrucomicrobiota bacterium]
MHFKVYKDCLLLSVDGTSVVLPGGHELDVLLEPVLPPNHQADEPLFDHGFSNWMFKVSLQLDQSNGARLFEGYRSPHDLWVLLRAKCGEAWALHQSRTPRPVPELMLQDLLFCSDGDRGSYFMLLLDKDESPHAVEVLDKHCGFRFSLYANQDRLYWLCNKGAPGRVTTLNGSTVINFADGFVFSCSIEEFLALPVYEPNPNQAGRWRKLFAF